MTFLPAPILLLGVMTFFLVSTDASGCACSASGDPHYRMCDGTHFDWQGEGTYTMFKNSAFDLSCSQRKLASNAVVSYIDSCTLIVTSEAESCDIVIVNEPTRKDKPFTINGKSMNAQGVASYMKQHKFQAMYGVSMTASGTSLTVESNTAQDGQVKVTMANQLFSINGKQIRPSMGGLCGTGKGKETNPGKNIAEIAKNHALRAPAAPKHPICGASTLKPTIESAASNSTPAPTTPVPTTPTTMAPGNTSAPTGAPAANITTPFFAFHLANDSKIPEHPVFESEAILKQVVKECMCGRSNETMETDKLFASFVENCIYDKSLGPGCESTAKSNLDLYLVQARANGTAVQNLDLGVIMNETVTKKPSEIKAGEGVTFELRLTKPTPTAAKADYLARRSRSWSGAAQSESSSMSEKSAIMVDGEAIVHKMRFNMSFEVPVIVLAAKKSDNKEAKDAMQGDKEKNPSAPKRKRNPSAPKGKRPSKQRKTKIPITLNTQLPKAPAVQPSPAGPAAAIAQVGAATPAPTPAPTAVPTTPVPTTPVPTTPVPTTPLTSAPIKQVQILTAMRSREIPGAPIVPQQTLPAVFQQLLAQQLMPQMQQVPMMAQAQQLMPQMQQVPMMAQAVPMVAVQPVPQVQAQPVAQVIPVATAPVAQVIPVAAAPVKAIAAAPAAMQVPQMVQMEAKPSPEQERMILAQQAGQRQALQDQQNRDRENLEREQKRAADQAKKGVKVQVPNPAPVLGLLASQPAGSNGANGGQGGVPAILVNGAGAGALNGNGAANGGGANGGANGNQVPAKTLSGGAGAGGGGLGGIAAQDSQFHHPGLVNGGRNGDAWSWSNGGTGVFNGGNNAAIGGTGAGKGWQLTTTGNQGLQNGLQQGGGNGAGQNTNASDATNAGSSPTPRAGQYTNASDAANAGSSSAPRAGQYTNDAANAGSSSTPLPSVA